MSFDLTCVPPNLSVGDSWICWKPSKRPVWLLEHHADDLMTLSSSLLCPIHPCTVCYPWYHLILFCLMKDLSRNLLATLWKGLHHKRQGGSTPLSRLQHVIAGYVYFLVLVCVTEWQLLSSLRFLADRFVEGTCPICGYEVGALYWI